MDKITIIFVLFGIITLCTGFTVTPKEPFLQVTEGEAARFYYSISPWPPPWVDQGVNDPAYQMVTLTFQDATHSGLPLPLCVVEYYEGVYDSTTGNCTLWEPRMDPFDPVPITGVYFMLHNTSYTKDYGEHRLLIEYGKPDIVSTTTLVVHVPADNPTVSTEPAGEVEERTKVNLTCRVNKVLPGANLRWTRGYSESLTPTNEHVATSYDDYSWSLLELIIRPSDHGVAFICWATNNVTAMEQSASAFFSVLFDPEVRLDPCNADGNAPYRVVEKDNAHFKCNIDANPSATLTWTQTIDEPEMESQNSSTYTVLSVSRDQQGQVTCSGQNNRGTASAICELHVLYGPQVTVDTEKVLDDGHSLDYMCTSDAQPPPHKYQWTRAGHPDFIQEGEFLRLESVSVDDAGVYQCSAFNTLNPTDKPEYTAQGSAEMRVHVTFAPVRAPYSLDKFATEVGGSALLVCDINSYPYVTIEWRKDGQILGDGGRRNISQIESTGYLAIGPVQETDFGGYECRTSNHMGSLNLVLILLLPGKPDMPQYCEVKETTENDATLLCVPGYDGGAQLSEYVETQVSGGKPIAGESRSEMMEDGWVRLTVHSLNRGTHYTIHVYALNAHGRSERAFSVETLTLGVPEMGNPNSGGWSLAAIISVTLVLLILLAVLIAFGVASYWKLRLAPTCTRQAQEMYENLPYRKSLIDPIGSGYENEAYNRNSNTYDSYYYGNHNKVKEPNEQRGEQISLAGMGALTYGSQQALHHMTTRSNTTTPTSTHQGHNMTDRREVEPIFMDRGREESGDGIDSWEVPRQNVKMKHKLGEGAFGEVWMAELWLPSNHSVIDVAVKLVPEREGEDERKVLRKELELMRALESHTNVVKLCGYCTKKEPVLMLLEYASNGNLQHLLRTCRSTNQNTRPHHVVLTSRQMITFGSHIASGMEFIASKRYLHRDLAARNILVDGNLTCKIADFGLARDIINRRHYESTTTRRLPIRWMPPEALFDSIYSTKSDVWAFGVVLWEIFTLGATPYATLGGAQIAEMISRGDRMSKPNHCPQQVYSLMLECWSQEPQQRPLFSALRGHLQSMRIDVGSDTPLDMTIYGHSAESIISSAPGEKC